MSKKQTSQSEVVKSIHEASEDFKNGINISGPFKSAKEMIEQLRAPDSADV